MSAAKLEGTCCSAFRKLQRHWKVSLAERSCRHSSSATLNPFETISLRSNSVKPLMCCGTRRIDCVFYSTRAFTSSKSKRLPRLFFLWDILFLWVKKGLKGRCKTISHWENYLRTCIILMIRVCGTYTNMTYHEYQGTFDIALVKKNN